MKDGSDKSLAIPIGISTHFEPPSLLDLLFEELDFPLEVYVVETFEVLVPDFLHVETVDGADVHALLAADALRVVELGNNDRFPLPVVRLVELRAARVKVLRRRLDLVELEVDALVRTDLRAQLATDALEPVDAVLTPIREGKFDLLVGIEMSDRLSTARHEAVDPRHRDERLFDRRHQRPDDPADRADLLPRLSFGLAGLHRCTRPSACPSAGLPAR